MELDGIRNNFVNLFYRYGQSGLELLDYLSMCCEMLFQFIEEENYEITASEADEFYTLMKLLFYYSHISSPTREDSYSLISQLLKYKDIYHCVKVISKHLPGLPCCDKVLLCGSPQCLRSQICIIVKSLLPKYIESTVNLRKLPKSFEDLKTSAVNLSCMICKKDGMPTKDGFHFLTDCKHLFCMSCFNYGDNLSKVTNM